MKATGIVRKIDDLGKIVIPKGIRRALRPWEGTPLEIFTDRKGEIVPRKYSSIMELTVFPGQYAEAMAQSTEMIVCITDRDQVIVVSGGSKKDMIQKTVSKQLEHVIGGCNVVMTSKNDKVFISLTSDKTEGITAQVTAPIICGGNAVGPVALLSRDTKAKFGDMEMKLVLIATAFLRRQMEAQDK